MELLLPHTAQGAARLNFSSTFSFSAGSHPLTAPQPHLSQDSTEQGGPWKPCHSSHSRLSSPLYAPHKARSGGRASLLHSLQQPCGSADTAIILTTQIRKLRFREVKLRAPSSQRGSLCLELSSPVSIPMTPTFTPSGHSSTSPLREPFPRHHPHFFPSRHLSAFSKHISSFTCFLSLFPSESPQGWTPGSFTPC